MCLCISFFFLDCIISIFHAIKHFLKSCFLMIFNGCLLYVRYMRNNSESHHLPITPLYCSQVFTFSRTLDDENDAF